MGRTGAVLSACRQGPLRHRSRFGDGGVQCMPRNDALAAVNPEHADSAGTWRRCVGEWAASNHLRTAAALGAAASLTIAGIEMERRSVGCPNLIPIWWRAPQKIRARLALLLVRRRATAPPLSLPLGGQRWYPTPPGELGMPYRPLAGLAHQLPEVLTAAVVWPPPASPSRPPAGCRACGRA